ncbi:MAG: hypothetical protein OEN01_16665 [Candidatus Krumholzibacteria bacterium]|nr:hypothetical protein [Candidatus Krumholzibacteria bacterium]
MTKSTTVGLIIATGILALGGGCTRLILWNPMFGGAELDKRIAFNIDGVGVKIDKFRFLNSRFGPEVHLKLKNFTDETMEYNLDDCKVLVGERVMSRYGDDDVDPKVTLRPGKSVKRVIKFEMVLRFGELRETKGVEHYIPAPSRVRLQLGKVTSPRGDIELPDIEYIYAYRRLHGTKFP